MEIELSIRSDEVADRITAATGQDQFRVAAALSGWVRGKNFRVTFPPSGFHHPYQPVLIGVIEHSPPGSRIQLTFASPWLGHLAVATMLAVFLSVAWGHAMALALGAVILVLLLVALLGMRKSQEQQLLDKLNTVLSTNAI